jgi:PfaD family protein
MAKVSRVEVAAKFLAPAPERFLRELVNNGDLTPEQALLATQVPVAQDLTAEADSGGHTDNRPALTLFPTMTALAERLQTEHHYLHPLRIGLGGGIATPLAAAAAFAMGAAYVVTGTVNQACLESGTSDVVRQMLAEAGQADVTMAPAADMFEMGVNLQVLKRGTMFAMRAAKLYELYRSRNSLDEIPAAERATLEKTIFKLPLDEIWRQTSQFFQNTDPSQIERAERDPKHKMALTFRWYLGLSPRWAQTGVPDRRVDYQVWCGPAIGAFNEWTHGSFLEKPEGREIVPVAMNLLYGAAVATRLHCLRAQGIRLEPQTVPIIPLEIGQIEEYLS